MAKKLPNELPLPDFKWIKKKPSSKKKSKRDLIKKKIIKKKSKKEDITKNLKELDKINSQLLRLEEKIKKLEK